MQTFRVIGQILMGDSISTKIGDTQSVVANAVWVFVY